MATTYAYAADIVKSERDANGDLIVYGKATGPDLDLDGQICDPAWLAKAMPGWMEWGNVREMHQPIAAGVGMELTAEGDDWMLKSKCVDPGTAAKIESGVLKGYSVGIRNAQTVVDATAPGGRIVGGIIVETSYVDRPCNPTAKMAIAKSAGAAGELGPVEAPNDVADKAVAAELVKQARDIAGEVRALVPDLAKGTPTEDIATAQDAIAAIARLIASEAESLAAGQMCDAEQIAELLCAVRSLRWFQDLERAELANAAMNVVDTQLDGAVYLEEGLVAIDLGATPDTTKTATPEPAPAAAVATETPAAPAAAAPPVETVTKTALSDLIKGAVAEATTPLQDRLKTVEADLAKALAQPAAGGPVLTRTAAQADAARATDSTQMREQADALREKAAATSDPQLKQGYLARAAELTAKAAA